MVAGIYRLFCTVSGKSYVGQGQDVSGRMWSHFYYLEKGKHYNRHLQASFNLHGRDAFSCEILEYCDQESLTEREQYWMDFYGFENLYNTCPAAGSPAGLKRSDETRQRMSEAHKGNQNGKGWKHSDETRQRISNNHVGMKGKKHSEETRQRIGEASKGRRHSDETRQRLSESTKAWRARQKAEKEATQ